MRVIALAVIAVAFAVVQVDECGESDPSGCEQPCSGGTMIECCDGYGCDTEQGACVPLEELWD